MSSITEIGKYKIIETIGKGGMGIVYKAVDSMIKRNVAIKMMTESQFDQEITRQRFFREAQAIGQLQHPNILTLYDAGEYQKRPYLVVEFLDGKDLKTLLKEEDLPSNEVMLSIIVDICDALEYSHKRGIIHRDIKPANIFILKTGEVKLMDFGIAKVADSGLTQTGTLLGTINYMSPEQIKAKDIDYRTDIFSLGVVMFEMFSHQRPYEGDTFTEVLSKILFSEPQPFEPEDHDLPDVFNNIIMKAIAKDRDQRYQSASELALDITKIKVVLGHEPGKKQKAVIEKQDTQAVRETLERQKPTLERKVIPKKPVTQKTRVQTVPGQMPVVKPRSYTWLWYTSIPVLVCLTIFVFLLTRKMPPSTQTAESEFPLLEGTKTAGDTQEVPTQTAATDATQSDPKPLPTMPVHTDPQTTTTTASSSQSTTPGSDPGQTTQLASAQYNNYISLARKGQNQADWISVRENAKKALQYKPNDSEAQNLRNLADEKIGKSEETQRTISVYLKEGKQAWQQKDYEKTAQVMDKVLHLVPNQPEALEYRRKAQQKLQEGDAPATIATQTMTSPTTRYNFLKLQGQHAYEKGDYDKCISLMDEILKNDPSNDFALDLKSKAHSKITGSAPQSIKNEISAMKNAFNSGKYEDCQSIIKRILAIDPQNKEALAQQQKLKAIMSGQQQESEKEAAVSLVQVHVSKGNINQAKQLIEQLRNQYPDDTEIQDLYLEISESWKQSNAPRPTAGPSINIKHDPPLSVLTNKKLKVTMTFFGYDQDTKVYVYYRATSSREWKYLKMKSKGVYHEATISKKYVKLPAVEYYFVIKTKKDVTIYDGKGKNYRVKVLKETGGSIPVF
ncbi:protein kinase [candidate division CSSED10-310 bacterium]|uniref:Protein kinase n=1 Tax=candidate division CSSED10-310 bacterium TaxID=2855610 RepID=A0ABV6Z0I4_UNCC1